MITLDTIKDTLPATSQWLTFFLGPLREIPFVEWTIIRISAWPYSSALINPLNDFEKNRTNHMKLFGNYLFHARDYKLPATNKSIPR